MSKLSKSEKQEVRNLIEFENGLIHDPEQLENDLIKFCNSKYVKKYKEKNDYQHIKLMHDFINLDGTEVDRTIVEDNTVIERVSVLLYQQSIKDRRERGINSKNDSYNIEPVGSRDIGEMRQYNPFYQMNGQKIYINKVSLSDTREVNGETVSYQYDEYCCRIYEESSRVKTSTYERMKMFYNQTPIEQRNEILFKMLTNLNKFDGLNATFREAYINFINQELKNYHILPNQQRLIDRILSGEIPNANQKKALRRALKI